MVQFIEFKLFCRPDKAFTPDPAFNRLKHKPITNTGFSNEMAGAGGILFQFLSQMSHINTQIVTVFDRVWPPYLVKELALGEHFSGIVEQHRQQAKFNWRKMHLFLTPVNHAGG